MTRPVYASEEERLAATHAAQERAREAIARAQLLKRPLPKGQAWTHETFQELGIDERFAIYENLLEKDNLGFYRRSDPGDFFREVHTNAVYYVSNFGELYGDFNVWLSGSKDPDSHLYLAWWEEPLPEPNVLVGNYNPETGVFVPVKRPAPVPELKDTTEEPRVVEARPQVAADKIILRMPSTVPFNRENLRQYYRKVALRFHPDKNPGKDTTEMFRKVQAAYERLLLEASE